MNPTIIVDASQRTTELEQYVQAHPVISMLIGIVVCSWMVTGIVKLWLPKSKNFLPMLITIDALIAVVLTALIFHKEFSWPIVVLLCLLFGAGSPFVYRILANLLCGWRPGMRKFLVLPELADPDPSAPSDPTDQAGA